MVTQISIGCITIISEIDNTKGEKLELMVLGVSSGAVLVSVDPQGWPQRGLVRGDIRRLQDDGCGICYQG